MKIQMFSMAVNAVKLPVKFNSLGVQRRVVHNAPFHTPRVFIDRYLQKRQTGLICKYHYYINVTRLVKNERENLFQKKRRSCQFHFENIFLKEKKSPISFRKLSHFFSDLNWSFVWQPCNNDFADVCRIHKKRAWLVQTNLCHIFENRCPVTF